MGDSVAAGAVALGASSVDVGASVGSVPGVLGPHATSETITPIKRLDILNFLLIWNSLSVSVERRSAWKFCSNSL